MVDGRELPLMEEALQAALRRMAALGLAARGSGRKRDMARKGHGDREEIKRRHRKE